MQDVEVQSMPAQHRQTGPDHHSDTLAKLAFLINDYEIIKRQIHLSPLSTYPYYTIFKINLKYIESIKKKLQYEPCKKKKSFNLSIWTQPL